MLMSIFLRNLTQKNLAKFLEFTLEKQKNCKIFPISNIREILAQKNHWLIVATFLPSFFLSFVFSFFLSFFLVWIFLPSNDSFF